MPHLPSPPQFPPLSHPRSLWLLMGGMSPEHEVSLSSALTALTHFQPGRYTIRPICIRRDGLWCTPPAFLPAPLSEDQVAQIRSQFTGDTPSWPLIPQSDVSPLAESDRPDLAVIIMHGPQGEDGQIQAFLESLGLNYTGSGVEASALAMDKPRSQAKFAEIGIPIPTFHAVDAATWREEPDRVHQEANARIGFPAVVKPASGGSSVGVTIVHSADAFQQAMDAALEHDHSRAMVEKMIKGRELTCGVLELPEGEAVTPVVLTPTEIIPREGDFFDYHCKYAAGASEELTPAPLTAEMTKQVQDLALKAHRAVGARGMSRTDFMLSEEGELAVLEINTIPGMTPTSLLPQGAASIGIDYGLLLTTLVEGALAHPIRISHSRSAEEVSQS